VHAAKEMAVWLIPSLNSIYRMSMMVTKLIRKNMEGGCEVKVHVDEKDHVIPNARKVNTKRNEG
jgi:hypothetical protein